MHRSGEATLPLHPGNAPPWLFRRMVSLGREISRVIILEFGVDSFVERLSDPFWFQSLSCVLGFDCHSSGTTTVTLGALKEGLRDENLGVRILGGKGKAMRRTPSEIEGLAGEFDINYEAMVRSSRLCAKVDNNAIQSGHTLYHHSFVINERGNWAVIEQGMREKDRTARRYHWLGKDVKSFVVEPHRAILGQSERSVINMVARESEETRKISVDLVKEPPSKLRNLIVEVRNGQKTIDDFSGNRSLRMPFSIPWKQIMMAYEFQPRNYEQLLEMEGIGRSTIRALSFISELIYDKPPSRRDPVRYSFTVGGKDGVPFPVDRAAMDEATTILKGAIDDTKLGRNEKLRAIKRLEVFVGGR